MWIWISLQFLNYKSIHQRKKAFYSFTPLLLLDTHCTKCWCRALSVVELENLCLKGNCSRPHLHTQLSSSSFTVEQSFKCLYSIDSNGDEIEKWGLKNVSADL